MKFEFWALLAYLVGIWWSRQLDSDDSYQQKQVNRFLKGFNTIGILGKFDSYQDKTREPYEVSPEYKCVRALILACAMLLCPALRLQK